MKRSVIVPIDSKHVTKIECYREPEWNEYRVELHMGKRDDVLVLSFRDSVYLNEVMLHGEKTVIWIATLSIASNCLTSLWRGVDGHTAMQQ